MGQKRGKVPAHIQPKQFQHPGVNSSWVFILNKVIDPRKPSCNTRHSVTTILFSNYSAPPPQRTFKKIVR